MKFSADRRGISEVLSLVQGITNRKTNLSITSDVLIRAVGSEVIITANDLETVFQGIYEADIASDGIISINSKKLYEIIREYPDPVVPINEIENRWVEIGTGKVLYHIVSSDYDNFPETPVIQDISFVEVDSAAFKRMAEVSTIVSASPDEKRIYVLGVLFEKVTDDTASWLRMVSTDSRRLNCYDIPFEGDFEFPEENVLIPKKGLTEVARFLEPEGSVQIGIKENHLIVRKENETIMVKLLDGDYPDYRGVLGIEGMIPIEMDRQMFLMVMKRMSILSSDDYKSVLFNFRENELVVTITNPDIGESKEEISIGYNGQEVESAFNPRYFIDALNALEGDTVIASIKDKKFPCILKSRDNDRFVCAIMAMTV